MRYIIYHDDADGIASALAAYINFKRDRTRYFAVNYGQSFPLEIKYLEKEDEVYILDFSYKKEILEEINSRVSKLVVIDHHETAYNDLKDLDYAIFDLNKSGATLSFEYFNKGKEMHKLFKLVEDRDLWRFQYEETEPFNLGVTVHDNFKTLEFWYQVYVDDLLFREIINEGRLYLKFRNSQINAFVKNNKKYKKVKWNGYKVAVYNATLNISELGSSILDHNEDIDFTISYFFTSDDKIVFNFRSKSNKNIHVGNICKELGGGGHKDAAGVNMPFDKGIEFIRSLK